MDYDASLCPAPAVAPETTPPVITTEAAYAPGAYKANSVCCDLDLSYDSPFYLSMLFSSCSIWGKNPISLAQHVPVQCLLSRMHSPVLGGSLEIVDCWGLRDNSW